MNKLIGKIQRRFIIGDDFLEKLDTLTTVYSDDFREEINNILRANRKTLRNALLYGLPVMIFALVASYLRPNTDAWIGAVASVVIMLMVSYDSTRDSALKLGSEIYNYIEALPHAEQLKVCKHFELDTQKIPYTDKEYYQMCGYRVYIKEDVE